MTANQVNGKAIEKYINTCISSTDFWIDQEQIANQMDVSLDEVKTVVKNSQTIVVNAEGKITTRELYRKQTPFFNKLINTLKNRID